MAVTSRLAAGPPRAPDHPSLGRPSPQVVTTGASGVPALPAGMVGRPRLVTRLVRAQRTPLVLLAAPTGWGKTTVLAQWAHVERRPVAWLTIEPRHNDAAELAAELDGRALGAGDAGGDRVLVLDDVHLLHEPAALARLERLVDGVTPGSQVVLSGRSASWLHLGRRRLSRPLQEVGRAELAMNGTETAGLLAGLGVVVPDTEVAELVTHTDGWPMGIHLAGLAHLRRRDPRRPIAAVRGSDREVAAVFRDRVLLDLDDDVLRFLTRTCILDRLSGPVCDAVVGEPGSAGRLDALAGPGDLFLIPLDRQRRHYRYHRLFADVLLLELRAREPELELELHERAASWYEADGDLERAVHHAHRAQALDRAGDLLVRSLPACAGTDREAELERALDRFSPQEVGADPALALAAAWRHLRGGSARVVAHWLDRAAVALHAHAGDDGGGLADALVATRAWCGIDANGVPPRLDHLLEGDRAESPWRALASLVEGSTRVLTGDATGDGLLDQAERAAGAVPVVGVLALAMRALDRAERGEWAEAEQLAERSLQAARDGGVTGYPPAVCASAVQAVVLAHQGDREGASRALDEAAGLLDALGDLHPPTAVLAGLLMAWAHQLAGDRTAARATLGRVEQQLSRLPLTRQAGLRERLARRRHELDASMPTGGDGRTLTPAERRVLEFLPTHLTLAEIAQRLYVSRNTVKSQAIAIYQKLGASSRGQAVERARQLGLLSD